MDFGPVTRSLITLIRLCIALIQQQAVGQASTEATEGLQTAALIRARRRWKPAGKYIIRLLRLRYRWHRLGRHLQTPRIQNIFAGIERKKGKLRRTAAAAISQQ